MLYAYARGGALLAGDRARAAEDVAFRVITANQVPDHATIARFRRATRTRSRTCSARCWGCARRPGWSSVGVVAVDGTKLHANARPREPDYEQIARELLEEAAEIDASEDEPTGEARGDELPPSCAP